ncbi:hypothetical protein C3432_14235 [Citrobacter amalonaticus]|uniref:DUF4434 domain-containing protein n=1 Tax=Citrobacter amalonaticus TaxID=35703 RepID=A0A2S4RW95_CITAM|nr:DUF4434 family protein [Citrobacter amalonaticus]POT56568.1 hypothetical protein C3432_14235 [Citrobacter amalonaticus]POT75093.1 hypothetical protein C3436_14705 [Citrobacter amalonaticus]POU64622.1 hypothetical protein C3430_15725 [Citrobacter amalonaticus]POV04458.1 hypothetical protein C3424_15045 [Citrobacter amalonaticus]
MGKFFSILLALLLVSPFSFAMNGIFWQPQTRDNAVSDAAWQSLMNQLHQQGFDTLILQWTRYGDAFTQESERAALVKRAAAAQQAGLKLIVGLNADPDFFERQKQPATALENYLSRLRVKDVQQARYWAAAAGIHPDGWYISAEIDDLNWRETGVREQMLKWLGDTRKLLDGIASKPVYISSFFAGNMSPDGYRQLVSQMHEQGVNVWVQDGSGVGKLSAAQRDLYLNATTGCQSSTPASGIVYELFMAGSGQTFVAKPKTSAEIASLLRARSSCGKDRVYFSLRYLPAAQGVLEHH